MKSCRPSITLKSMTELSELGSTQHHESKPELGGRDEIREGLKAHLRCTSGRPTPATTAFFRPSTTLARCVLVVNRWYAYLNELA